MLPTIDEMIERDIERENEEREQAELSEEQKLSDAQAAWSAKLKRLTNGRKPVETEIKA